MAYTSTIFSMLVGNKNYPYIGTNLPVAKNNGTDSQDHPYNDVNNHNFYNVTFVCYSDNGTHFKILQVMTESTIAIMAYSYVAQLWYIF